MSHFGVFLLDVCGQIATRCGPDVVHHGASPARGWVDDRILACADGWMLCVAQDRVNVAIFKFPCFRIRSW